MSQGNGINSITYQPQANTITMGGLMIKTKAAS